MDSVPEAARELIRSLSALPRSAERPLFITDLQLSNCRLTDEDARLISSFLPETGISRLSLMGNQIGDDGAASLAEASRPRPVMEIDLSRNEIGDAGATAIANSLKSVIYLAIEDNEMTEWPCLSPTSPPHASISLSLALPETQQRALRQFGC